MTHDHVLTSLTAQRRDALFAEAAAARTVRECRARRRTRRTALSAHRDRPLFHLMRRWTPGTAQ